MEFRLPLKTLLEMDLRGTVNRTLYAGAHARGLVRAVRSMSADEIGQVLDELQESKSDET